MHKDYTIDPQLSPAEAAAYGVMGAQTVIPGAAAVPALQKLAKGGFLDNSINALLLSALVTGVPLGVASHHIDRSMRRGSDREKALRESIKYYGNATHNIKDRMAEESDEVEV